MFCKFFGDGNIYFGGGHIFSDNATTSSNRDLAPVEEIPLRQPFQGLKGDLRKMAVIGEMKSQTEDGRKGKTDGRGREKRRRRLQKENK